MSRGGAAWGVEAAVPMSEPGREHVTVVARRVMTVICVRKTFRCDIHDDEVYDEDDNCPRAVDVAHAILTSTDPAVLDAMQDALVRAGRLREDHQVARGPESWAIALRHGRVVHERRLVTEWTEETP